eukprot:comp20583_c0_seq1/m.41792 comp20583_c0_seq1/g.41792  ORF comp20583_c0_seq1/g.41792 comp20583_c0_seq1/m.41792 type:complete len:369 (-) comp20583_c0_seq1:1428-2534(-)
MPLERSSKIARPRDKRIVKQIELLKQQIVVQKLRNHLEPTASETVGTQIQHLQLHFVRIRNRIRKRLDPSRLNHTAMQEKMRQPARRAPKLTHRRLVHPVARKRQLPQRTLRVLRNRLRNRSTAAASHPAVRQIKRCQTRTRPGTQQQPRQLLCRDIPKRIVRNIERLKRKTTRRHRGQRVRKNTQVAVGQTCSRELKRAEGANHIRQQQQAQNSLKRNALHALLGQNQHLQLPRLVQHREQLLELCVLQIIVAQIHLAHNARLGLQLLHRIVERSRVCKSHIPEIKHLAMVDHARLAAQHHSLPVVLGRPGPRRRNRRGPSTTKRRRQRRGAPARHKTRILARRENRSKAMWRIWVRCGKIVCGSGR